MRPLRGDRMKYLFRNARAVTFVLLAALLPATAHAEWRRLDSPNFVVIGDVSERNLRRVAAQFEGFRDTLGRVLGANATATAVPTVVVVFPNDRAYTPYKPVFNGKPVKVGGVFYRGRHVNYITLLGDGSPGALRVLFHEYAHLVVSNVVMNLPAWLSEGLAEFYSTYDPSDDGREALIGRPIDEHLTRLSQERLLSLDELLTVDRSSPLYNEGERRSIFYAQSWALTHMLMLGDTRRTKEVGAYLMLVREGTPAPDAWRQAFGAAPIARELDQYLRRFALRAYSYKFPDAVSRVDATPVRMSEADVSGFLGGLRVRQARPADARTLADGALKSDAGNAHAQVVKALVAADDDDYAAAIGGLTSLAATDD